MSPAARRRLLVYSTIASLDGYTADAEGKFDWAEPDAEVHAYVLKDGTVYLRYRPRA